MSHTNSPTGGNAQGISLQEQAGQEERDKYVTIINSMDEGFCILQLLFDEMDKAVDYRYIEINSVFEKQTGMSNALGKTIKELVPDIEPFWCEIYGKVALTGISTRFEDHAKSMGRWFDVNAFRIGNPQDRQVAVFFKDITLRKRREANLTFLHEISQDFSRLSSPNQIMHIIGEKVGRYLQVTTCSFADVDESKGEVRIHYTWNQANVASLQQTFRLEDYLTDEFARAGRAGESVVVDDTGNDPRTDASAYAALQIGSFVTIPFHRNREWKAYLAITDANPRQWRKDEVELFWELSYRIFPRIERARAEEALVQSQERLQKAISIETVGVIFFDLDGNIHDANEAFRRMSGYSKEDFRSGHVRWDKLTPTEFMDATLKSREELLTKGENTPYEKEYIRPDGSRWWGLFAGKRLSEKECVEFVLDITQSKQAQQQLQALTKQLATANGELSRANEEIKATNHDLKTTNLHLLRVNADLDNFIYTASHDLKAPINNIEGLVGVLRRKMGKKGCQDEAVEGPLRMIEASIVRFKETVSDLTEIVKVQKQLEGQAEAVDLKGIISDILLDLSDPIEQSGACIEQHLEACPQVVFPKKNLKSVLYNLVSNAIKYADPSRCPHILIACKQQGEYQVLSVEDNGLGMDTSDENKIFGMFKRQHTHVEGTGIGLYIVKKIIENAGGKIRVESKKGKGSIFHLYLKSKPEKGQVNN